MIKFIKKNQHLIILLAILLVTIGFRVIKIDKSVWRLTGYDESRDILVAKHIVNYQEFIKRGPLAAGGQGVLMNSPIYYYFLAAIWLITGTPLAFMWGWSLLMSGAVLIGYFVGKELYDQKTGLILASILAVNQQAIYNSRELLQPHLLMMTSLLFIWSMLLLIKKLQLKDALLATFFLLIPLHFHYGVLLIIPAGVAWLIYYWLQINKTKGFTPKNVLGIIILGEAIFLSWIFLSYKFFPFDQFYFPIISFERSHTFFSFYQLRDFWSQLLKMIWQDGLSKNLYMKLLLLFASVIAIFKRKKRVKLNTQLKRKIVFLASMSFSIILLGFIKIGVITTYLTAIFPFLVVILALFLRFLIKETGIIGWIVTIASLIIMTRSSIFFIKLYYPDISYHDQQKNIATIIHQDYLNLDPEYKKDRPKFIVTFYTTAIDMPFDGWGTSGTWFYLEELFNQPLIKLTNYGVNHQPIEQYPKYIYLICDHRSFPKLVQVECIDRFHINRPFIEKELQQVGGTTDFTSWRATVKPDYSKPRGYLVHQEIIKN